MHSKRKQIVTAWIIASAWALVSCVNPFASQRDWIVSEGETPAIFYTKNDYSTSRKVYLKGVIFDNTANDFAEMMEKYPNVETIVMENVPGSVDDEVNLQVSLLIHKSGLNTHIPKGGMVASGGTDMFLAGSKRSMHPSAKIGVHSWSDGEKGGSEFPKDDPQHQLYLDYYRQIGIDPSFYWFTLKAAPADGMHNMTPAEIKKYKILR